ncbi:MAG TPA: glycogen synthase [Steroidobacteraceae bacterium]|nr:glycogen synthase [Steroidobacteraceae bacterium]
MPALKVCMLSAEIVPFAKTGGLADVAGALVRELSRVGHEVRAFMPLYAAVKRSQPATQPVPGLQNVGVTIGSRVYAFSVRTVSMPGAQVSIYLIDCPELFDRPAIYTRDPDEHRRFLLFTRAALESCLRMGFAPDIFHCHDWHTGFLPLFLKSTYSPVPLFARSRSVLTIHNIGYQGVFPSAFISDLGLIAPESLLDAADLQFGVINSLKSGIKFADAITTVSPTHAREITETALGMGMEATLRARPDAVIGILNGVDYEEWDPRRDPYLTEHFSAENLQGKHANKLRLLAAASLRIAPQSPLVGMVTRLASQKGIDILMDSLPQALGERDFGLVVLGSGEERYAAFFESLVRAFRGRAAFYSAQDEPLAHLIEAGSDMFLMPSQYEPCGLNQMYSLRYGTIPIVRRTGGLADSVRHFDPATGSGTGCVFNDYDAPAALWAMRTALGWFNDADVWRRLMHNAMQEDFSWQRQIAKYVEVYRNTAAEHAAQAPA